MMNIKRDSFFSDIFKRIEKCYLDRKLNYIVMRDFDKVMIE